MVQLLRSDGSSGTLKLANLGLRVIQFLIAIPIIAIYATQLARDKDSELEENFNTYVLKRSNLSLAIASGVISLITSFVYIGVLLLLDFKWICYACPWDLIVMILFAATFGQFKSALRPGNKDYTDALRRTGVNEGHIRVMQDVTWVDLVAMLLWLITFVKGVACIVFGRLRGSKPIS